MVIHFAFYDLWSLVFRRTTDSIAPLSTAQNSRHSKVDYLQIAILIEAQILQFYVSMNYVIGVQVSDAINKLTDNRLDLLFVSNSALTISLPLEVLLQVATPIKGHDEVEAFISAIEVVHSGEIGVRLLETNLVFQQS